MTVPFPTLQLDLSGLEALERDHEGAAVKAFEQALLSVGQAMQQVWITVAQREGLHDTGDYVRGITAEGAVAVQIQPQGDLLVGEVSVTNRSPRARMIEEGTAAYHLPDKVRWGATGGSIKMGKKGPYLHIPFRHTVYADEDERQEKGYTDQAIRRMMPADVSAEASKLRRRLALRVGPIRDPESGRLVAADRYRWDPKGTGAHRLQRPDTGPRFIFGPPGGEAGHEEHRGPHLVAGAPGVIGPAWKTSRYQGLFKAGPPRHTAYLTIRTMTPTSPGWWIPAKPGRWIVGRTVNALQAANTLPGLFEAALAGALGLGEGAP